MDYVVLLLAASGTALATGVGTIPVFLIGERAARWQPALWGVAAGVMVVASVLGLLVPALDEASAGTVAAGVAVGVAFLLLGKAALRGRDIHLGELRGANVRRSALVFAVLFVHSLPEGLAVGAAYASDRSGVSLFVIVAIAIQNVPEGTAVAVPMQAAGFRPAQQFWAAVLTSAPQPVGAVIAFALVEQVRSLLPVSLAFAAGAMLALVVVDLAPEALRRGAGMAVAGAVAGGAVMALLAAILSV